MIVLRKKRIIYLISVLMVSFVVVGVNNNVFGSNDLSHVVILDAGHGQPDRAEQ